MFITIVTQLIQDKGSHKTAIHKILFSKKCFYANMLYIPILIIIFAITYFRRL